ncbi:MAG: MBL fold metallo-hydrolase [Chitinophagales bacterium]
MKIAFHGAARRVTGSKHLVELQDGTNILLDCGLFQGNPKEIDSLNRHFGFSPVGVNYILLSHAHIDHCGLIPKLYAEGFRGTIYCTPATFDLTKILLLDSAKIHESDVAYHNKKRLKRGEDLIEPLYKTEDVYDCLELFKTVPYHNWVKLGKSAEFCFSDAGHIIGSASITLKVTENKETKVITFSGDVGRYNDEILKQPEDFPQSDYIILESTYGDSLHEEASAIDMRLLEVILHTCVEKGGNLIIPAFSVGRTQELVYALNRLDISKRLPNVDVYIDSPLSSEATEVVRKHEECFNEKIKDYMKRDPEPFDFARLHYITDVMESKALNKKQEPCVIISASGMADAGRIKHHIKHNISSNRNTILLVGYCEPNSLGGKLMNGAKEVTIFGEPFSVNAEVRTLRSLSAHGDMHDLLHFLGGKNKENIKKLFLVHGEYDVQQNFRTKLNMQGYYHVEIPEMHQQYQL